MSDEFIIDETPPILDSFTVDTLTPDLSEGAVEVTVTLSVTPDGAPVDKIWVYLRSATNDDLYFDEKLQDSSGDVSFELPEYLPEGSYTLEVKVLDAEGEYYIFTSEELSELGFDAALTVTGTVTPDLEAPTLEAFSISEPTLDEDEDDTLITVNHSFSDDVSGVLKAQLYIFKPGGGHLKYDLSTEDESTTIELSSELAGGTYEVKVLVMDHLYQTSYYYPEDLTELGFDFSFELEGPIDDDGNNGHGNDEDGFDDSNPGNSTGTHRRGSDDDDTLEGDDGNDTIIGGDGNDDISGGNGDDVIWAGSDDNGSDEVEGGEGDDTIGGGKGHDMIVGGSHSNNGHHHGHDHGSDVLFGGDGDDTIIAGSWDDFVDSGVFDLSEANMDELDPNSVWGGDGDDLIVGANGNDTLGGGTGDDYLEAGAGDDTLFGGRTGESSSNDTLHGGDGNDVLYASFGNDSLHGGDGDDLLFNGMGEDTVRGGDGNDTIWGGGNDDILSGGDGADTFIFGENNGFDTVTDFSPEEDILDLSILNFESFEALTSSAEEVEDGLLITSGGTVILLEDVDLPALTEENVIL